MGFLEISESPRSRVWAFWKFQNRLALGFGLSGNFRIASLYGLGFLEISESPLTPDTPHLKQKTYADVKE
ncbi:MAG: hypothetical protein NW226_02200 [Microscillaceae bacterium]|nr:hypothetical protein [Microscillaceae bacterium]